MIEEFDEKNLQELSYETTILSSDNKLVGCCELGKATIKMLNKSNEYSNLKGTWISTIHGSFYIYDVKPVQESINIKLDCYDIKYKLKTKYDSALYTFPMTLKEWRNAIFTNCGVQYDNSDFPNSDLILSEQPYLDENLENIQVISLIAESGSSNVITDANDKFYFSFINNTTHIVKDWLELTTESSSLFPINAIVLGRGTGDDVFYPNVLPENPNIFRINNNYILDPQSVKESEDRRNQVIQPIYNRLNGFKYIIYSMRTSNIDNKLSIKLGDKINYKDIWGNSLESIIMTKKINWLGGDISNPDNYEITLSAEEYSNENESNNPFKTIFKNITELSRKTDKQEGIIQDLVSSTTEMGKSLETTKSEFELTKNSIKLLTESVKESAISITTEYYLSDSRIELIGGSWIGNVSSVPSNKCLWFRTKTTYSDSTKEPTYSDPAPITGNQGQQGIQGIQGEKGNDGAPGKDGKDGTNGINGNDGAPGKDGKDGRGISSKETQYYSSTSNTTQTDGSWSTTQPNIDENRFLWIRDHIVWDDNTTTDTTPTLANFSNDMVARYSSLKIETDKIEGIVESVDENIEGINDQISKITQTGGSIDLAIQQSKQYTDTINKNTNERIDTNENNYNTLNNKYETLNGIITDMNFSFNTQGLSIGTSGSDINSILNNKGLKIYNAIKLISIFNQNGSGFGKLIATDSIQYQNLLIKKRTMNTSKANNMEVISFFFNKSLIEDLADLESET